MPYPLTISRTSPFDDIEPMDEPERGDDGQDMEANISHSSGRPMYLTLPRPPEQTGVESLRLFCPGTPAVSQSLSNSQAEAATPVTNPSFCFAPGVDPCRVGWDLPSVGRIEQVELKLFRGSDKAEVTLTDNVWAGDTLEKLYEAPFSPQELVGTMLFTDAVKIQDDAFPGGVPTIEHAPYLLKLVMTPTSDSEADAYPTVAWTYFDVRAKGIAFEWGAEPEKTLPISKADGRDKHLRVLEALTDASETDNLKDAFPVGDETKKVYLLSNRFYRSNRELLQNSSFAAMRELWGDGPQIPVYAHVLVESASGEGVAAPQALGAARFLWDWVDAAAAPKTIAGMHAPVMDFLNAVGDYKTDATEDSPAGRNCHVDRGGKRGLGAKPVFPPQEGQDPADTLADPGDDAGAFPFSVSACPDRKWAAISTAWTTGALQGKTGVVFQPSFMAGDAYRLRVFLLEGAEDDNGVAWADDPEAAPAQLQGTSGRLEMWREVTLCGYYSHGTGNNPLDIKTAIEKYGEMYLRLRPRFRVGSAPLDAGPLLDAGFRKLVPGGEWGDVLPPEVRCALLPNGDDPAQLGHVDFDFLPDPLKPDPQQVKPIMFRRYKVWFGKLKEELVKSDDELHAWGNAKQNTVTEDGSELTDWIKFSAHPLRTPWPVEFLERVTDTAVGKVTVEFPQLMASTSEHRQKYGSREIVFSTGKRIVTSKNTELTDQDMDQEITGDSQIKMLWDCYQEAINELTSDGQHKWYEDGADAVQVRLKGKTEGAGNIARMENIEQALRQIAKCYWVGAEVARITRRDRKTLYRASGRNNQAYGNVLKYSWYFQVLDQIISRSVTDEGMTLFHITDAVNCYTTLGKAMYADADTGTRIAPLVLQPTAAVTTLLHEIGHSLFLNHTYASVGDSWRDMRAGDPYELHDDGMANACVMKAIGSASAQSLCGFCHVRVRGWSVFKVDPADGSFTVPEWNPSFEDEPDKAYQGRKLEPETRTILKTGNNPLD